MLKYLLYDKYSEPKHSDAILEFQNNYDVIYTEKHIGENDIEGNIYVYSNSIIYIYYYKSDVPIEATIEDCSNVEEFIECANDLYILLFTIELKG